MKVHEQSRVNPNLPFCGVRRVKLMTKDKKKVTCLACINQREVRRAAQARAAKQTWPRRDRRP